MDYMHIDDLYKNKDILLFKEAYAMEKIHGTSSNLSWNEGKLSFFSGGANYNAFMSLFNQENLESKFSEIFPFSEKITVYGEAYGGKLQGMSKTYGTELRFVVFDVKVNETWLNVPNAEDVAKKLGLEFVDYCKVSTDLDALDAERDKPSCQAMRNLGIMEGANKMREGIVLRPIIEMTKSNGDSIICKHKRKEFAERKTVPEVNASKVAILEKAEAIADEWVTEMRLSHVLDKFGNPSEMSSTPMVVDAMMEDVMREASGEIIDSKEARKAIGAKTVKLFKTTIQTIRG